MPPTRRLAAFAAFCLLTPFATAGTETSPEVKDAAGDAAPAPSNNYADVLAVWFSEDAKGLRGHEKMGPFTADPPTMTFYQIFFATTGCAQYFMFAYLNGTMPEGFYGSFDSCANAVGEQIAAQSFTWPSRDKTVFEMTIPRAYLNGTYKGDNLTKTGANTGNGACGFAYIAGPEAGNAACTNPAVPFEYDHAGPGTDYVVTTGPERPGRGETGTGETGGDGNATAEMENGSAESDAADAGGDGSPTSNGGPPTQATPGFEIAPFLVVAAAFAFGLRRR